MTIDDYIKWANKEIEKNEFRIDAAYSVPGIHYDAEAVKRYENNIEHYKQLVEYLEGCKKGYIHIDDVYRLIAGHSNYHGDSILSALTCIAEGKNVTKPITPLDSEVENDDRIIRCKDCKYRDYWGDCTKWSKELDAHKTYLLDENMFCGFAEKKGIKNENSD